MPLDENTSSAESDLEGRLRGMILGNAAASNPNKGQTKPSNTQGGESHVTSGQALGKKQQNRRPNQAQRRQNSLNIDLNASSNSQIQSKPRGPESTGHQHHRNIGPKNQRSSTQASTDQIGNHGRFNQNGGLRATNSRFPGNPRSRASIQDPRLYHAPPMHGRYSSRPSVQMPVMSRESFMLQASLLENLAAVEIVQASMPPEDVMKQIDLRGRLEHICCTAILQYEQLTPGSMVTHENLSLQCFGSLRSGFATRSSDMDLTVVSPLSKPPASSKESPIPRLLEKVLLDHGYGARLLTKTRVPIIRFCERPTPELLEALKLARQEWESETGPSETKADKKGSLAEKTDEDELQQPVKSPESDKKTLRLKQKNSETLSAYYRRAKRTLEKSGIQDFYPEKKNGLSEEARLQLLDAAKLFLTGISDEKLRNRLLSYESLDLEDAKKRAATISLFECLQRAEGENLSAMFDERKVFESNDRDEALAKVAVEGWTELQKLATNDAIQTKRTLMLALDKLKTFKSIRLAGFQQLWEEKPEQYCKRAEIMLSEMTAQNSSSSPLHSHQEIFDELVRRFISGISNESVRSHLETFISHTFPLTLSQLFGQYTAEARLHYYSLPSYKKRCTPEEAHVIDSYALNIREHGAYSSSETNANLTNAFELLIKTKKSYKAVGDRFSSPLDYPKEGVGIQCDINFSNHLALHNTDLLRCYSLCDVRVQPMVVFIKSWAKRRGINSPYRGTLSSYGYVLMVLHYLMNVASPPVIPNLQLIDVPHRVRPPIIDGYEVHFFRDEQALKEMAAHGTLLPQLNDQPLGYLLREFFEYYAQSGYTTIGRGFSWANEVVALRTAGGILTKQQKGWIGAKTTYSEPGGDDGGREIRHRYLLAIEDPFETDHNIARTVAHDGICKIRDEFRRAMSIIIKGSEAQIGSLFEEVVQGK